MSKTVAIPRLAFSVVLQIVDLIRCCGSKGRLLVSNKQNSQRAWIKFMKGVNMVAVSFSVSWPKSQNAHHNQPVVGMGHFFNSALDKVIAKHPYLKALADCHFHFPLRTATACLPQGPSLCKYFKEGKMKTFRTAGSTAVCLFQVVSCCSPRLPLDPLNPLSPSSVGAFLRCCQGLVKKASDLKGKEVLHVKFLNVVIIILLPWRTLGTQGRLQESAY